MPVISAIFLVAALAFAVVIGPQTRPWTWGPAMLCLAVSSCAALPGFWNKKRSSTDFGALALAALTAGWFGWRAWMSPVGELGHADILLLAGAVGAFVGVRAIAGHDTAERVLSWGLALLLLASLLVVGKQLLEPSYSPVFRGKATEKAITGFFAHYIEGANFLVATSMLVGAAALFGKHSTSTRVLWALIAIAGLAGVWFTRSRGGIFAAAIACGVFAAVLLIIGKRRKAKWFAPVVVALPLILAGLATFLFLGWKEAQELRRAGTGIEQLLDNNARLYFLGIALSCIGLHPMAGGGSRSFGWECFRFVEGQDQGDIIAARPEFVHNEVIQAATDYGLIGAGLLAGLLGFLAIAAVLRLIFEERAKGLESLDAGRLGGLAALAGMIAGSSFCFVFHLMPGAILLGLCLGGISLARPMPPGAKSTGAGIILTAAAVACAALLVPAGWSGTRVTRALWSTHYGKNGSNSTEARLDALGEAIRLWPHSGFYQERAALFQTLAQSGEPPIFADAPARALDDYEQASRLHPFEPGLAVNRANVLSQLQRDGEAEEWYVRAIQLQGGMEPGFRGHFSLANHFLRKGLRLFDPQNPEAGHEALEQSAQQIETALKKMHWIVRDMLEPRVSIHESLGTAREAAGDREGALEAYNFASSLQDGKRAHYRAGVLIGKMAVDAWSKRRPGEAMFHFIEARRRIGQAGTNLPLGVTPSQSAEYIAYLDRTIAFLKGAKVTPEP